MKGKELLWTWDQIREANANTEEPKRQPKPVIEVLNRTNRTTYVVKRARKGRAA